MKTGCTNIKLFNF